MLETVIQSTDIFDGRIVHLKVHDVRLPDGQMSKREVIHHVGAVSVIVTDKENNVLLVQQFRLPVGKLTWEIPAGTLEPEEPLETCASRELQEETGYKPLELIYLGGIHPAPAYTTEIIHIYWSRRYVESRLDGDADEFVEAKWLPMPDTLDMITRGEITDSKTVVALLKVARELHV